MPRYTVQMLVWLTAFGVVGLGAQGAVLGAQGDSVALGLFSQMMPVFRSPRCINCHGGVDPATDAHEGGKVDVPLDAEGNMRQVEGNEKNNCLECHTAANRDWRLAPRNMSFVGKDALALCLQLKRQGQRVLGLAEHMRRDKLIGLAFVGQGGVGDDSPFAPIAPDPPSMSQEDAIAAAQQWLDEGKAGCGGTWNGTITQKTRLEPSHIVQPGGIVTIDTASDLTVSLKVTDSAAKATVHYTMHSFTDSGRPGASTCVTQHHDSWAIDNGAEAHLDIYVTIPVPDPVPGGPAPPPMPGQVLMRFTVPKLKGTHHSEIRTVPTCQPVPRDESYEHSEFAGLAEGPVDPKEPDHLVGKSPLLKNLDGTTTSYAWDLQRTED